MAEDRKPPPPWSCEACGLVNWPRLDGQPRTRCHGCGQGRGIRVFVGGEDVTDLVEFEAFEMLTEGRGSMTYEEFVDADPFEQ